MKKLVASSIVASSFFISTCGVFAHEAGGNTGGETQVIEKIGVKLDFSTKLNNSQEYRHHLRLKNQKSPIKLGVSDGSIISDLWGWTDPRNGDRYVITIASVGNPIVVEGDPTGYFEPTGSIVFARISKKGKITPLGAWKHPDATPLNPLDHGDVKVFNNHAYVMFERESFAHGDGTEGSGGAPFGIVIFDLKKLSKIKNINIGPDINKLENFSTIVTDLGLSDPISDSHNIEIDEKTGYMAIYSASLQSDSDQPPTVQNRRPVRTIFLKIDKHDPIPKVISVLNDEGSHDGRIFTYHGSNPSLKGKVIHVGADGYAATFRFLTGDGADESGVVIYQLADENGTNVKFLGRANYANIDIINDLGYANDDSEFAFKFSHSLAVSADHEWIMIADEDNNGNRDSQASLIFVKMDSVVDNDPTTNADFFCLHPEPSVGHNQFTSGNLLIRSNYTSGVRVVDISKISKSVLCPESSGNILSELAFYDTEPRMHGSDTGLYFFNKKHDLTLVADTYFSGTWSVYTGFDDIIVATDFFNGLLVLELDLEHKHHDHHDDHTEWAPEDDGHDHESHDHGE